MRKIIPQIVIGILLIPLLAIPNLAHADGMLIKPDPYSDRWDYSGQTNQQAFINYENKLEKMIISIGMEEASEEAVWIFPIPANPDKIAIDVVTKFPQLEGEEITKKAKSNLLDIKELLQATQIYPVIFKTVKNPMMYGGMLAGIEEIETGVTVYEHLEKEGVTTEIITAKTSQALYKYLQSKNLKVEKGSIPVLDHYIGKEFTFVISWISEKEEKIKKKLREEIEKDPRNYIDEISYALGDLYNEKILGLVRKDIPELEKPLRDFRKRSEDKTLRQQQREFLAKNPMFKEVLINFLVANFQDLPNVSPFTNIKRQAKQLKQKGVFVTFPTKKIYYPLFPTSVYRSETIPVTIRVMGFVNPKVFKDIKSYTKVEHFIDDDVRLDDELKNFYSGPTKNVKYTKIEINAPSKFLTDDLWISQWRPLKTYYSSFIAQHPLASRIFLLILSSVITGLLAGWIVFRELRNKNGILKLALVGLSNCLSIIGLLITTIVLIEAKERDENVAMLLSEMRQKGYIWKRRLATLLFFVASSFLIVGALILVQDPFISKVMRGDSWLFSDPREIVMVLIIFIIGVISLLAIVFAFIIKRIKTEDKSLFAQLKSAGYSSWSFEPKDGMKFAFIPLFSVSFLVISWLIVKLIEWSL